jgi:hypothetical protein
MGWEPIIEPGIERDDMPGGTWHVRYADGGYLGDPSTGRIMLFASPEEAREAHRHAKNAADRSPSPDAGRGEE